jgi:hypothetical protein
MRILALAAIAALSFATPSVAQTANRSAGTTAFTNLCVSQAVGVSTPEPTCACGAGVISGRMTDRQYGIMARLSPHSGNQPAMTQEMQRMIGEGYTAEEMMTVGQMLIDLGPLIESTCGVLQR